LNLLQGSQDELISDVAKEVCEKVIDHSQEGTLNLFSQKKSNDKQGAGAGSPSGGMGGASLGSGGAHTEYNIQTEIRTMCSEHNLQVAKNLVINLEKLMIQKKIKIDKFESGEMHKLVSYLKQTLEEHERSMDVTTPEGVMNS
jgi:hypothetical protein